MKISKIISKKKLKVIHYKVDKIYKLMNIKEEVYNSY